MPAGTRGFRLIGEIERADYSKVLVPELRKAIQEHGELRTLYVMDPLEKMDPGALWEDLKAGLDLGLRQRSVWRRTAFVSDQEWLVRAAKMIGWVIPGDFKRFPVAELAAAKRWVADGAAALGPSPA